MMTCMSQTYRPDGLGDVFQGRLVLDRSDAGLGFRESVRRRTVTVTGDPNG